MPTFEVNFHTVKDRSETRSTFDVECSIDELKTLIKLKATNTFNHATITQLDGLKAGDVDRWIFLNDRINNTISLRPFSVYEGGADVNLALLNMSFESYPTESQRALQTLLGGCEMV